MLELSIFDRYVTSLYWAIVTFASVGYGDYSPISNPTEQIWCMIFILLNIILLSWIIGSITLLIVKGDEKTGIFRDALHVLHQYSLLHSFDKPFEKALRNHLKLEFDNREIADEVILKHFPSSLRRKVLRRLYLPSLLQTRLMKGVRPQFVDAFLVACKVEIFGPGEEMLKRGNIASELYLLVGGTAKLIPWEGNNRSIDDEVRGGGSHPDSTEQNANQSLLQEELNAWRFYQ